VSRIAADRLVSVTLPPRVGVEQRVVDALDCRFNGRNCLADGNNRTKSFSVLEHGQRKAFRLAVAARRELLRNAQDRPYLYDPLAKKLAPCGRDAD
jgi:AP2 domain